MPTVYMIFWSVTMIIVLGVGRVRSWSRVLMMALVTAFVLILSQTLFIQLSISAGLEPSSVLNASQEFLMGGPLAWLALLVMPCGWLGPFIGLNLVHRWRQVVEEIA